MPYWFENSKQRRESIVNKQKKQIAMIYRALFLDVRNIIGISKVKQKYLISNVIKNVYFNSMERSIRDAVLNSVSQIEPLIKENMRVMSGVVMDDNKSMLRDIGFERDDVEDFDAEREEKIKRIVFMIISGELYDKKWTLSGFTKKEIDGIMKDVHKIISKCLDEDMEMEEIGEYLELYFNPDREKKKKFFQLFPGVRKKIDYNTKRTGNTLVGHAYEETFVNVTMNNPFIEAYRWITSGSDKVCPVCIDRESTDKFGLGVGIFPKDQLPLDHPNGMCTFDPVYVMPAGDIVREVDLWKRGGSGSMNDRISKWVKSFKK